MAGIYIHIPFCAQKCYYCDFYSNTLIGYKDALLEAIAMEIALRKSELSGKKINTIYFGGGTPSMLKRIDFEKLLGSLQSQFNIDKAAEITLEANPEDLSLAYLKQLKSIGINRLSIGIQSLNDDVLKFLNRRHSAEKALQAVLYSREAGFENLSVDLIYGIPGQEVKSFESDLKVLLSLNIQHLSAYHLSIEQGTVFGKRYSKGKLSEIDDSESQKFYKSLCLITQEKKFEHYEISNFSLPGFRSKHNTSYWNSTSYLGLGPSAHSYINNRRCWNLSSTRDYIDKLKKGIQFYECEDIDIQTAYNEYLMTRLRTIDGVSCDEIQARFGEKYSLLFLAAIEKTPVSKYIIPSSGKYIIDPEYWLISNRILVDLIE